MTSLKTRLAAILLLALSMSGASAADGVCDHCGCSACVRRVCVPKLGEKEITKVCWDYKCEDVCIPGPSTYCGEKCAQDDCGCYTVPIWKPNCACVKTRRVPVKTEVKRKVPAVKWVVEYRCPNCCQGCTSVAPQGAPADESGPAAAVAPTASEDPAPPPPAPEKSGRLRFPKLW